MLGNLSYHHIGPFPCPWLGMLHLLNDIMQVLVERTPLTLLASRIVVTVPLDRQHPGLFSSS